MKNKHQLVWGVILLGAIAILIGYSIWLFMFAKSADTVVIQSGVLQRRHDGRQSQQQPDSEQQQ
jgi:hypothetical protein